MIPKEDLGQILVGQLRSGELYALPASYYDFDLAVPESAVKRCAAGDASCSRIIAPVSLRQPSSTPMCPPTGQSWIRLFIEMTAHSPNSAATYIGAGLTWALANSELVNDGLCQTT